MRIKHNFLKLVLALTLLSQGLVSMDMSASAQESFVRVNDNNQLEKRTDETDHLPIRDLYELLQEHDRIYDEEGGFYELIAIEDIIPEADLERVIDELNSEEGYATVADWALFNIEGEQLPMPRTHVVRHQRFLGTTGNSRYFFRHVPGFNADGALPPTTSGNGWRMQTWQINLGGVWVRAFCTQPGTPSSEPGNNNLTGWNPSNSGGLSQIQRETIGRILMHGYRNVHRPPTSNSENWSFPSGSGADALLDDAILVTQIMIQEVAAGQWTWQNITSGTRSPINNSGVNGDPWRRLIANSATSNGMVGGPTGNVTQGWDGGSFNPRPAIGSTRRMDMYDGIRHDIYFFHRRGHRPRGTSVSSATANRPVHTLTWSNTHQMYRIEIDDRISSNGTGTLRRFLGNRTSGTLGSGYRFCRGTQTAGVCNPSTTSNRLIIYTRDSTASALNTPSNFMVWNPTGSRDRAVGFFVNPNFQNKVVGAIQDTLHAHFRVQVTPRSRPPVQAIKYSNATGERLAGATIQLCRGSSANVAGQTVETGVTSAWCWEVVTDENGVANFPVNGSLVNADGNRFDGMMLNRRYRVQEIEAPAGYFLPSLSERTNWVEVGTGGATSTRTVNFRNDLVRGRVRIEKLGSHIVGFDSIMSDDSEYIPEYEIANGNFPFNLSSRFNPPHLTGGLEVKPRQGVTWIFEDLPIEDVRFNIYARDNIVLPDGTIYHEAGAFVGYYYTDAYGFIESEDLHLGNYFIREISAPNGWHIHDGEIDFSLVFVDQYTAIVFDDVEVENQWMTVEINLLKVGEVFDGHLDFSNRFDSLEGVHFGLFAGEDFEFVNGQILSAGSLIEDGFTDANGRLQFNRELPLGIFFVQEIAVAEHYVVDNTRHYFEHTGDEQDAPHLEIELERIYNHFVRGSFEVIKISRDLPSDSETDEQIELDESEMEERLLADVHFELWSIDLDEYVATFITDMDGRIFVDNLIFGNYRLTEVQTDSRHQLNADPIYFTIDREHQSHSWVVINYKTNTNILKVDGLGDPLADAHFQIVEVASGDVVEEWISTEEAHIILGLNHGEHILRETQAPTGFILGEDIHFVVTDAQETIYIVAENILDISTSVETLPQAGTRASYLIWVGAALFIIGVGYAYHKKHQKK